ncbi:SDR family NAD(P)-dependent oxidoreductase [Leucobacter luti]|uniref:SDR family NAD(P)-dependent oxidoreductase n=1 Tax=Leucobacter luti TaxID=340320 RepID=UPI003CFFD7EE
MTDNRAVAVVTGASSGMGREIVLDLARTHRVIAIGRDAGRLAAVAAEADAVSLAGSESADLTKHTTDHSTAPSTTPWQVDVTDADSLARLIAGLDRIDVLVHAAAIGRRLRVDAARPEDWAEHFATNVTAPAELTRLALPLLRAAQGTVVFIGSGASTRPAPGSAVYTATKHALRGLADVLRIDEEPNLIRVVTVAPGQTDTPMLRGMVPEGAYEAERYIRPASVAAAVRFAVDAPADVQITDLAVRPRQEIARI